MNYQINNNEPGLLIHADLLEPAAKEQINLLVDHPAITGLIAIMPDVHLGSGCVIGTTARFTNAVIPNIVGVDIGCGVLTYKLPSNLGFAYSEFDNFVRKTIPLGFNSHENNNIAEKIYDIEEVFKLPIASQLSNILMEARNFYTHITNKKDPGLQLGTLGGGNHFIELEKDKSDALYLTVHTGSRNFGKQVADYYQGMARQICIEMNLTVPKDMEYLPMSSGGKQYMHHLKIAQDYAALNRRVIISELLEFFGLTYDVSNVIESVHNYIDSTGIIRKGAISARLNEQVVIPLNMGEGIILGVGKGNPRYNWSAPHGAGRVFGRQEIFRHLKKGTFSMDDYRRVMSHVFSTTVTENTFDESPFAYKTYANIEKHLNETVNVKEIVRPVYNIKAGE